MGDLIQADGFVEWKKWMPDGNVPLIIKTKYGVRRAVYDTRRFLPLLRATDCTHPEQNTNMEGCVISWKYANPNYNGDYHVNKWERVAEGEKILNSIKPKSIFSKIKSWLWER